MPDRPSFFLPERVMSAVHHITRSEGRWPARLTARVQRDGQPDLRLSVRNFSGTGLMGVAAGRIQTGETIRIVLPRAGSVRAQVRWSLNNQIGCHLEGRFSGLQIFILLMLSARSLIFSREGFHAIVAAAACTIMFVLD